VGEFGYLPYSTKFSATWRASSRVGSRIRLRGMRARARLPEQDVEHRQGEAGGLAGAGLGAAEHVPSGERGGDRHGLDRGRRAVALFEHGAQDRAERPRSSKVGSDGGRFGFGFGVVIGT
jgi:hypothetical protein